MAAVAKYGSFGENILGNPLLLLLDNLTFVKWSIFLQINCIALQFESGRICAGNYSQTDKLMAASIVNTLIHGMN